jgi:hypothetical protein
VLTAGEARQLHDSIESGTLIALWVRALIAVIGYNFARVMRFAFKAGVGSLPQRFWEFGLPRLGEILYTIGL